MNVEESPGFSRGRGFKITVKELPETTPQEIIDSYCKRFGQKGEKVKTEHKDGNIIISIEDIFDD